MQILKTLTSKQAEDGSKSLIVRSGRMRMPACSRNRYLKSFVPQASLVFNSVITH